VLRREGQSLQSGFFAPSPTTTFDSPMTCPHRLEHF